jgi:hypothetical protein
MTTAILARGVLYTVGLLIAVGYTLEQFVRRLDP